MAKPFKNKDMVLTTPYNFVPLSKKVVRPEWASLISHDLPFEDGVSGSFSIEIEAKQPIFTRNNMSRKITNRQRKKELEAVFSKDSEGKYFIPGSSIKGTIRNVLEIMSFGDLSKGLNDEIWGMRDLNLDAYKELFSWNSEVHCGWLRKEEENYVIDNCGIPARITHEQIDKHFGKPILANWVSQFENTDDRDRRYLKYSFPKGTALIKTELFSQQKLIGTFKDIDGNQIEGTLVFTGQPSINYDKNKKGTIKVNEGESIKYKEFIFPKVKESLVIEDEVLAAFDLAYPRKLPRNITDKIPVFFHLDKNTGSNKVKSFGMAYMYKIPFTHSVKEAIQNFQEKSGNGPDMAECIFGHTHTNEALKGRVIFGHAFAEGSPKSLLKKSEVLNSPKATYYPTYVQQKVDKNGKIETDQYQTLFDNNAVPSGWKRYPVHGDDIKTNPGPQRRDGTYNTDIQTDFIPLNSGTKFSCVVNFHNLKRVELGALLSALSFHNAKDCFHSFGMAKPLGYGKCTVEIKEIDESLANECLCEFEQYMEQQIPDGWINSPQLKELIAMSQDQNNIGRSVLEYMKDVKDFAKVKREKLALDRYSNLDGIQSLQPQKLCNENDNRLDHLSSNRAGDPEDIFNQRKNELINELRIKQADLKKEEQELEAQRIDELKRKEEERIKQERIELEQKAEKQRLANRQDKQNEAKSKGLVLENFDITDRNAFNNLSKEVTNYAKLLHNKNDKQLQRDLGDQPWVQEADFELIVKTISDIFENLPNQKEIEKWKADFEKNYIFKKVVQWIGKLPTESLYVKILNK